MALAGPSGTRRALHSALHRSNCTDKLASYMTALRSIPGLCRALAAAALLVLSGCEGDGTSAVDAALIGEPLDAALIDATESDAADSGPVELEATTVDECHGSVCLPSHLPRQQELEFLEPMGDGWLRLMEADWEMAPNAEGYRCMTLTVPEDVLITAFAPQSPPGTHHATFGVSPSANGPDGVYACGVGLSADRRLQGSGAGTEPSELPPGIAMRVHRGEQIMMNVHLFNATDEPLRGRSGMWIKTIAEGEAVAEAETVLAGPLSLFVPVGRSTQRGRCTLQADVTLFSVAPHMHQKGIHMRASALKGGRETVIYDGDYDFDHQLVYAIDPIKLRAGDAVEVECTYENDTDGPIRWGDSTLDEMCFIGVSLYPAFNHGALPCAM